MSDIRNRGRQLWHDAIIRAPTPGGTGRQPRVHAVALYAGRAADALIVLQEIAAPPHQSTARRRQANDVRPMDPTRARPFDGRVLQSQTNAAPSPAPGPWIALPTPRRAGLTLKEAAHGQA